MAALDDQAAELRTQRCQILQFAIDLGEMFSRDQIHRRAGYTLLISETEQRLHLIERKSQRPGAPDEAEPREMLRRIGAIIVLGAVRHREQAGTFVIADRLDLRTCCGSKLADAERP